MLETERKSSTVLAHGSSSETISSNNRCKTIPGVCRWKKFGLISILTNVYLDFSSNMVI